MEIIIDKNNINDYLNGKFNDVTEINWRAGQLKKSVIDNFPNLQKLHCGSNQITTLKPLSNCVNLQILYCYNNRITSLEPLSNCVNLKELYCYNNRITSLEPLSNCVNLKELYCWDNQITSLEPLSNCVNLQKLICWNNQITSLEPISNCVNLKELNCQGNRITSLTPIVYLRRLIYVEHIGNPLEVQTIQVQRFLDQIQTNRNSSIYNDGQNIHDTEIQRCVCDSVRSLLSDSKLEFSIDNIISSDLNPKTKEALIEYCQDQTIHSVHLITYKELLSYVWNRIIKSEHQSELKKILEEQIADAECMCFTGRFNRTLSVLVGFYSDIKINISDKSRIAAIILNSRDKIVPYDSQLHQETARTELIEAGYIEEEIVDWIDAIADNE